MSNKHILVLGFVVSAGLLGVFVLLQQAQSTFLDLPMQWLVVIFLPILVALFVGGYIKRFKGFGIELEAALKQPVTTVYLTASEAVADIPGDGKKSIAYLNSLPKAKAQSIRRLLFVAGRVGYYTSSAIAEYLKRLPNIAFLEVRTESDDFVGFLPVSAVRGPEGQLDHEALERFVEAVATSDLRSSFPAAATTLRVSGEQSLVEVLKKMRSERAEFAAVISPEERYLGVVLAQDVERRIVDSVLAAKPR